jgi:GTPase SAR1 family protein
MALFFSIFYFLFENIILIAFYYTFTKCFMGYTTVGKTCLVLRFLNDEYEEIDDPTLGTAPTTPFSPFPFLSFIVSLFVWSACSNHFLFWATTRVRASDPPSQRTATGRSSWSTTTKSPSYATHFYVLALVRFVGVICMAMCVVVLTSPRGGSARIQDVLDTGGSEEHHYLHDKVCSSLSSRPVSCVA